MILFTKNPFNFSDGYFGFVSVFGWLFLATVGFAIYRAMRTRRPRIETPTPTPTPPATPREFAHTA
jgi:hypothetical protein